MKVFIDTSAWFALSDKNDKYHKQALFIWEKISSQKYWMYSSLDVINETISLLRFRVKLENALDFGDKIFKSTLLNIIEIDQKTTETAFNILRKFNDKDLSFTDCTSMAIISIYNIDFVFTFDKHFEQTGFNILR